MQGVSLRRVLPERPGAGMAVLRLHYSADPQRWNPDTIKKLRSSYTSEARWRREMEIVYEALEGSLLYPQFSRDRNLCEAFDVSDPDYWTIWMGLDPHPRTAHAMLWEAFNKHGDRVICGEFWPEFGTAYDPGDGVRWTTKEYAEWIQLFESDSQEKPTPFRWARGKRLRVFRRFMDTYGKASNSDEGEDYFETYRKLGHELSKKAAVKDWPAGHIRLHFDAALKGHNNLAKAYDSIGRALMPQQDASGKPAEPLLRVFEECVETIDEFENVRFPEGDPEKISDERPVTYQKHALDCMAYIETARPRYIIPRRTMSSTEPLYEATAY